MMSAAPKVSVVITCYNYGRFLEEAIDSVLRQTYRDFEIVIVDDGSTDPDTQRLLIRLAANGLSIHQIPNSGPSAARNFGIKRSRGTYILPLDADDVLAPSFLAECAAILDAEPHIDVVHTDVMLFGASSGQMRLAEFSERRMVTENCLVVTALYRRVLWEKTGGYNEGMRMGVEDWDFWIGCLEQGARFKKVSQPLFYYRIKPTSHNASYLADAVRRESCYRRILANHPTFFGRQIIPFHEDRLRLRQLESLRGLGALRLVNRLLRFFRGR
jgi:glycosyltransferase involved in cell wall biosynthesis